MPLSGSENAICLIKWMSLKRTRNFKPLWKGSQILSNIPGSKVINKYILFCINMTNI